MFRRYLLTGFVAGFLVISSTLYAGESEIILKDNTTASGLTVKEETANTTIARFRGDGNVGIGTTEPATKLDITHVNSDADLGLYLRGSSAPNTRITSIWSGSIGTVIDAKGVASGSGLHFYIDGSEKVRIDNNGNVGIGITSPQAGLDIQNGGDAAPSSTGTVNGALLVGSSATATSISMGVHFNGGDPYGWIQGRYDNGDAYFHDLSLNPNGGNVGVGTTSPQYPLHMGSGAHVTTGGVWTNASSREYKKNIRDLTVDEAMQTLDGLRPSRFNYKVNDEDEYVGFIAEDVPELVATRDRKGLSPMDITAVLTKVVQEQQRMLQAQQEAMDKMKQEIKMLKSARNYGVKGL